jgi:isopentenyl-diphosphate Delta-isomerase
MEEVILVDLSDKQIGTMEKMRAHKEARLHRAFSVFLFNDKNEMLIHKRAPSKYHSPNLWTNACCSHPRPGEKSADAALRRMQEELGMNCDIKEVFSFTYKRPLDQDLTEYEFDHVFIGHYNGGFKLNAEEVAEIKFILIEDLRLSLNATPELYTEWFRIICNDHMEKLLKNL